MNFGNTLNKAVIVACLTVLAHWAVAQQTDTTSRVLHISGSISANNNGFSLVPTFSLGEPAVQSGFNFSGKGRLSFHPQLWYSMLDYKPWSMILIWRYKLVEKNKFTLALGAHAPAVNFQSATVEENGVVKEVVKARRFYPAGELLPTYRFSDHFSLGGYILVGKGIEAEVNSTNVFISLRPDFNNLPLSKQLLLSINPQVYYLGIDDKKGAYFAAGLTVAHRQLPFSVGTMINQELTSEIDTKPFVWNVGLTYSFAREFVGK